jgi:ATP-binding cassette, subfamily B, bacterial PglK
LVDDTLRRNIAFGVPEEEINDKAIGKAILAAHLTSFVSDLKKGVEIFVVERGVRISGGQRQRIDITRALYDNRLILVLDEATSALDTNSETYVMEAVNDLKGEKTINIVAHRLPTLSERDKQIKIECGEIVDR